MRSLSTLCNQFWMCLASSCITFRLCHLTLSFQTPSKTSRETCVPVTKWGNSANAVCQPAWAKWVVQEEEWCQFPALGKKVPPTGTSCCAACQERRLLSHCHSCRHHRWRAAKRHLLSRPEEWVTQEQANSICFSISNYLKTKKDAYK